MKNNILSIILIIISLQLFGQVKFEKGYFINNDGQRTECLIKNNEREDNPKEFRYKHTETTESKIRGIDSTKEFGIPGVAKFIRVNTKIDRSTRIGPHQPTLSNFSDKKEPLWSDEQLFLKVVLEGKASLFCYVEADLRFYFYSVNDSAIKQLIYKDYKIDNTNQYKTNNEFRLQLWKDVKCDDALLSSVEDLNYKQNELVAYFNKYNSCTGSSSASYVYNKKRDFFNLRFTTGVNFSSVSITNLANNYLIDFKNKTNLRIGLDAEIIIPFNRNKWALVFEPTYNSFNSSVETSIGKVNIAYNYIEFPFGIRYKCFLKTGLILYFNGFMIPGNTLAFKHTIDFEYSGAGSIEIKPSFSMHNYAFGIGGDYKRISAEIRYYTIQNPLFPSEIYTSDYNRFAFIFEFKIL